MKNLAVVCANGLGDALLMMTLCSHLKNSGAKVSVFHPLSNALNELFPDYAFLPLPKLSEAVTTFKSFDKVYIQNDHSKFCWHLIEARQNQKLNNLCFLFPKPCPKALISQDFEFEKGKPFVTNLKTFIKRDFGTLLNSKYNDLFLEGQDFPEKNNNLVAIHPTSKDLKRNWKKKQFLVLAQKLKELKFFPVFIVAPEEAGDWDDIKTLGFTYRSFQSLQELCLFLSSANYFIGNDSGLGHLASLVNVHTLTISGNKQRVATWRPDFFKGDIVCPRIALPSFRSLSFDFRGNFWQNFVSVKRVYKTFLQLKSENHSKDTVHDV